MELWVVAPVHLWGVFEGSHGSFLLYLSAAVLHDVSALLWAYEQEPCDHGLKPPANMAPSFV